MFKFSIYYFLINLYNKVNINYYIISLINIKSFLIIIIKKYIKNNKIFKYYN